MQSGQCLVKSLLLRVGMYGNLTGIQARPSGQTPLDWLVAWDGDHVLGTSKEVQVDAP